ncbi:Nucleolar Complex 2 protein [Tulasnella sp. 424]|nr:Nucleolar Complex 2 protein [Tulasnella sp. 424]KAG8968722.1 Nucleolar Complex 2 protein [Tulasnella sp. 425]
MAKKGTKRTRKFAAKGGIQAAINARRKHQKKARPVIAKKAERARGKDSKGASGRDRKEEESEEELPEGTKFKGMSVDDFLKGDFMGEDSEDGSGSENGDSEDDSASFASLDEFDDEERHVQELSQLAEKDPVFYKYLQENEPELLGFSKSEELPEEVDDAEMSEEEEDGRKILTKDMLDAWKADIIKYRSLKSLRQLLTAFRASSNLDDEKSGTKRTYTTESPELFNQLVVASLKFAPMVLMHHIPYKELPDGRFKPPAQVPKTEKIARLVASFLSSIAKLMTTLSDTDTQVLALNETSKLIPYVSGQRRAVKNYLKMSLEMWSNGEDEVRLAAYMALRRLGASSDTSLLDMVLKASYLTMVRGASKSNDHTMPSLNLMKNTASELYCMNQGASYQHAFSYIRQLAFHLRGAMKVVTSSDALRQVYNWQFVHCVDFWCMVLAKASAEDAIIFGKRKKGKSNGESELKPLIFPLVQVALGAIKLGPGMRHYPLHLHLIRSLLHLIRHTKTYIPLAPYILPILTAPLSPSTKFLPAKEKLKPLDLSVSIHVPAGYMKTRILAESIVDDASFLLAEWSESLQGSIAFPELMLPVIVTLKRCVRKSKGGKNAMHVKTLVERIEEGCRWVESKRANVKFAPGNGKEVESWEGSIDVEDSPMAKWVKVQRKARAVREEMKRKAATGEGEMLDDEESAEDMPMDEDEDDDDGDDDDGDEDD